MLGLKDLSNLDLFERIQPLDAEYLLTDVRTSEYENQHKIPDSNKSTSEWEISNDDIDRNAFDMFDE